MSFHIPLGYCCLLGARVLMSRSRRPGMKTPALTHVKKKNHHQPLLPFWAHLEKHQHNLSRQIHQDDAFLKEGSISLKATNPTFAASLPRFERSRQMSRERQQRIKLQASACWHENSSSHLFCSETLILLKSEQGICYETKAKRRVGSRG